MNPALTRIATAIGAMAFLTALIIGCANGVDMGVGLCRAAIVMIVTTVTITLFLRFFTKMLIDFVSQRAMEQRKAKLAAEAARKETPL